jgi:hypothetical protein
MEVHIAEESAIIVWDAAAKREHFVRRASFRTSAQDFGFLVPTPAKPELAEVPDHVFSQLEWITRPEVKHETVVSGVEPTLLCGCYFLSRATKSAVPPEDAVRVLDAQRVAGFDAVVLEADSAGALAAWLKEHGYADRNELRAWLAPYVAARWKISAFKIAGDHTSPGIETGAIRMTFAADRPFYPYREPSDQRENLPASARRADRLLRVFFLGAERVDGSIGAAGAPWPGKAVWSDRFDPGRMGEPLPFSLPEGAWLTMFEDRASPRPGTDDLFFAPARDRGPVKPPPVVQTTSSKIPLPLDVIAVVGFVVWKIAKRVRRRAAA